MQTKDKRYPLETIPSQITFEDNFPFPKAGYVSSISGNLQG